MKQALLIAGLLWTLPLLSQSTTGELRLSVTDPDGSGLKSTVELVSQGNEYRNTYATDDRGNLDARRLPYGIYRVEIRAHGFAEDSESVEVRSAIPMDRTIRLRLGSVSASIKVTASGTVVDPYRAGSVNEIGLETLENRLTALPGRSMQDLVNSEPGWLYEGNAVLHPRGSEYQTQFVVDGIPLTDNRSPGFGPEVEADDVESLKIYTAGIPAEYGRKMGGVIEVNTLKSAAPGLHGQLTFFGGTYATGGINAQGQYTWKGNTIGASASGNRTGHYLDPVVPENYTNNGTTGSFTANYERDLTQKDRLTLIVRHELARYEIPNELVQQNGAYLPDSSNTTVAPPFPAADQPGDCVYIPGGQLQTGGNFETMGSASYQHIFSADTSAGCEAWRAITPMIFIPIPRPGRVIATQHNDFKELYFSRSGSIHHGRQEWKAGVESDATFLNENFSSLIPDCTDPSRSPMPHQTGHSGRRRDDVCFYRQPSGPGTVRLCSGLDPSGELDRQRWTAMGSLPTAAEPKRPQPARRLSRYFPALGLNLHGSYDRIFQTPSFENILLSSSSAAETLDTSVPAVQLPVPPSHGSYYELGLTKALVNRLRVDANMFRRDVNNYADDSQVLSTGISFPISFRKGILYGAEGKLEVQNWRGFSGVASYSYIVGNVWNPVTGGLFLGEDAASAVSQTERTLTRLAGPAEHGAHASSL